jgi:hypothetical protein
MECIIEKDNIYLSRCSDLPAMICSMITTPANFKATPEEAVDPDFWQDAIKAGKANRIYLWPRFVGTPEDLSEETIYEDGPLGILHVRDGNYRFRFSMKESLCLHKAMYSHRATSGRVILFDVKNQMIGTLDEDDNFMGFTIQLLNTEKLKISDGSVSTKSPIYVALANNLELDQNGGVISASFVNTLQRLADVKITVVGTPSSSSLTVDVKTACDSQAVSGLAAADFALTETDGDTQTIGAATESTSVEGRYTLTGSGWVDGFISLKAPAALSIDAYEVVAAVAVNVP